MFSNQHGPDKLVVVMDATNANSLQAARNVGLFKHVSVLLDKVRFISLTPRNLFHGSCA